MPPHANAKFTVSGVVVEAEYCETDLDFWGRDGSVEVPEGSWAVTEDNGRQWFAVTHEQIQKHYEPINIPALKELRRSGVDVDHIPGDGE